MDIGLELCGVLAVPCCMVVVLAAILIPLTVLAMRRKKSAWAEYARRTGLAVGSGSVAGTYRGRSVRLYAVSEGGFADEGGGSLHTCITVAARNTRGGRLGLIQRGLMAKLESAIMGLPDLPVGDPEFDRQFIVRGEPPEFVGAALGNAALRQVLARAPGFNVWLNGDALTYRREGEENDVAKLCVVTDALVSLAEAVEQVG